MINNKTGTKTRIWGDPHVDIGDNGTQNFHFKKNLTFQLADGTKITVKTVKAKGPNGPTLSSKLTITNGNKAIVVRGLGMGKDGALKIAKSNDGKAIDARTWDGDITLKEHGDGWVTKQGGKPVTQRIIDKAEGKGNRKSNKGQGNHEIDLSDFAAMAHAYGINNQSEIDAVFNVIARGGDEISDDEMKKVFGNHPKPQEFREEFNRLVPRRTPPFDIGRR